MYAAQLRQKPEYRDIKRAVDNVNKYRAHHICYWSGAKADHPALTTLHFEG